MIGSKNQFLKTDQSIMIENRFFIGITTFITELPLICSLQFLINKAVHSNTICTIYVHIERDHLVDMELRPWHNIRINLSQNKPNLRSLSIKFKFLEMFEI